MNLPRLSRPWFGAVVAVFSVAVGAAIYYQLHIRTSRDYLTQRNFRVLAVAGRQVVGGLRAVIRMIEADLDEALGDASKSKVAEDYTCGSPPEPDECPAALGESCRAASRALKQRLQLRRCLVNEDAGQGLLPQIDFEDYALARSDTDTDPPLVTVRDGGRAMVSVRRSTTRPRAFAALGNARVNLRALVEPFLVPGVFESVLLLDESGHVVMTAATDLQVSRLGYLRRLAPGPDKEADKKAGPEAERVPRVEPVEVAGRDYLAFCQPLEFEGATPPISALCGLAATTRFDAESVALNPYWFVILTAFVVMGALSWPLLKVAFVGPGERVRMFDLVWLGLSLLVGTAFLTLLSLDLAAHYGEMTSLAPVPPGRPGPEVRPVSAWQIDEQLTVLSGQLASSLEAEIDDAVASLGKLALVPRRVLKNTPSLAEWKKDETDPGRVLADLAYPFPNTASWIDPAGRQVVKWSTGKIRAPRNEVGDRAYFVRAKNEQFWRHGKVPFSAEVVRSRSNGEPLLVLVTRPNPSDGPSSGQGEIDLPVVALASRAISVMGSILPPGYGFALLDGEGGTVMHSEDRHALEENFVEETGRDPRLLAVLFSGSPALLDIRYWGQPHRALVRPLHAVPWTLVVFYESNLARTVHLEALTLAFFLSIALLLILGLYAGVARFVAGAGRQPWVWPQQGASARYAGLVGFFVVTGLLSLLLGRNTLAPVILFPLAAAGLGVAVIPPGVRARRRLGASAALVGAPLALLMAGVRTPAVWAASIVLLSAAMALARRPDALALAWPRLHSPGAPRLTYVAWALAALFAFSAAPAARLYRLAWDRYTRLYVQYALLDMGRRLDHHPLAKASEASGKADATPGMAGRYRFFYGGGLVDFSAPGAQTACGGADGPDALETTGERLVPLYNAYSIRLRRLGAGAATEGAWQAGPVRGDVGETFCLSLQGEQSGRDIRLESRASASVVPRALLAPLGLLLTGLGAGALLLWLTRRLFLLDFKDPETVSLVDLADKPIRSDLLIICPPLGRKERLLARSDLLLVDLQGRERKPADLRALLGEHPRPRILCFDRFEVALQDADSRASLLAGLELAVSIPGPPLILLSETDPEPALGLEGERPAREGSAEADLRRRWAQLLGRFVRVVAVDPGEPEEFAKEVARAEQQALALSEGDARRIREAFAALRRECSAHHALQEVGRVLLDLPNFPSYDRDRLVRHVRELADSYYRGLWFSLPDAEKLLLHQIAAGDVVNPRAGRALSRLLALRLVVRDVTFRIVNESLARFVSTVATREDVLAWQRTRAAGAWESLRVPVLIAIVSAASFLAYSERDTMPALLASVGAVVPVLAKLLEFLRPQKAAEAVS